MLIHTPTHNYNYPSHQALSLGQHIFSHIPHSLYSGLPAAPTFKTNAPLHPWSTETKSIRLQLHRPWDLSTSPMPRKNVDREMSHVAEWGRGIVMQNCHKVIPAPPNHSQSTSVALYALLCWLLQIVPHIFRRVSRTSLWWEGPLCVKWPSETLGPTGTRPWPARFDNLQITTTYFNFSSLRQSVQALNPFEEVVVRVCWSKEANKWFALTRRCKQMACVDQKMQMNGWRIYTFLLFLVKKQVKEKRLNVFIRPQSRLNKN